jgi:hypothetical protein
VPVYVCPACGERLTPEAGSIMPRPCPRCLERTGRVVEMVEQGAKAKAPTQPGNRP